MRITFDTIPIALEMLLKEIRELRADMSEKPETMESKMVDRLEARKILGTHGKPLSEARFAQLKKEGKVFTYGFGGKHFYNVEELGNLKRK